MGGAIAGMKLLFCIFSVIYQSVCGMPFAIYFLLCTRARIVSFLQSGLCFEANKTAPEFLGGVLWLAFSLKDNPAHSLAHPLCNQVQQKPLAVVACVLTKCIAVTVHSVIL